jgi:hypothetical protein
VSRLAVWKGFALLQSGEWLRFLAKQADWSWMAKLLTALRFERKLAIECQRT